MQKLRKKTIKTQKTKYYYRVYINVRVIKRYRLDRYRVKFDTKSLEQFLEKLFTYKYEDDVNNYEKEKLLENVNEITRAFNTLLLEDFNII